MAVSWSGKQPCKKHLTAWKNFPISFNWLIWQMVENNVSSHFIRPGMPLARNHYVITRTCCQNGMWLKNLIADMYKGKPNMSCHCMHSCYTSYTAMAANRFRAVKLVSIVESACLCYGHVSLLQSFEPCFWLALYEQQLQGSCLPYPDPHAVQHSSESWRSLAILPWHQQVDWQYSVHTVHLEYETRVSDHQP